jgi:hypothetical protein
MLQLNTIRPANLRATMSLKGKAGKASSDIVADSLATRPQGPAVRDGRLHVGFARVLLFALSGSADHVRRPPVTPNVSMCSKSARIFGNKLTFGA